MIFASYEYLWQWNVELLGMSSFPAFFNLTSDIFVGGYVLLFLTKRYIKALSNTIYSTEHRYVRIWVD